MADVRITYYDWRVDEIRTNTVPVESLERHLEIASRLGLGAGIQTIEDLDADGNVIGNHYK